MKILFYIHGISGGGGERVLSTIANQFFAHGEEVHLATNLHTPFQYEIQEGIVLHDLYKGTKNKRQFIKSIIIRRNIRAIAKKTKPDVIVAFMSALGCSVIFSTFGLGIPVIVSEHTNVSRFLGHLLNIKRRLLYPFAKCITILTRYDRDLWRKKVTNAVYMPNPITLQNCQVSMDNRKKVILAVGRVNQWDIKGFDNLLKCWAVLCNDYPEWKLQIAGDADEQSKAYLTELANSLGAKNYEFLGFRTDVADIMHQSEIFCLSSRVEGLPMALIEAMNAGCCCVSFDIVTGPREIIVNNHSGLIAINQDNNDLIQKLRMVLSNTDLRHKFASNAPSSVKKYATDRIIRRWYILFDKILKK